MKVKISPEEVDKIVRSFIKEHKQEFKKWDGISIPYISYDKRVENKYRKKMRKAFKLISEYVGEEE
jgi:hypothetical protein